MKFFNSHKICFWGIVILMTFFAQLCLAEINDNSAGAPIQDDTMASTATSSVDKDHYIVNPEDILNIQVWGQEDMKRSVEVSGEGEITFPPIGKVRAAGLTITQLEFSIAEKLKNQGLLVNPKVSVDINRYGSLKAFIMGEVAKPGRYFLKGKIHILALISEAGGLTESAGNTAIIIRNNAHSSEGSSAKNIIKIDIDNVASGQNFHESFVLPGDTVQIPKAENFYVTGEVKNPGQFKWEKGITVRRALAMAGGPTAQGAPNRITIQRLIDGKEKDIHPRMTDLVKPRDIIDIPDSFF